jgi:hypothetical protein
LKTGDSQFIQSVGVEDGDKGVICYHREVGQANEKEVTFLMLQAARHSNFITAKLLSAPVRNCDPAWTICHSESLFIDF